MRPSGGTRKSFLGAEAVRDDLGESIAAISGHNTKCASINSKQFGT